MEEVPSSRETLKAARLRYRMRHAIHIFEPQAYGPSHLYARSWSLMNLTVLVREVMAPSSWRGYLLTQGDSGWLGDI